MKHYTLFNIAEVVDPYGSSTQRGRLILTETTEPLTDAASIFREVLPDRHGPFVSPVSIAESVVEFSEELVRGAMLLRDSDDVRCWILPITGDVDIEVSKV
jgi:hypothetical protein